MFLKEEETDREFLQQHVGVSGTASKYWSHIHCIVNNFVIDAFVDNDEALQAGIGFGFPGNTSY